MQNSCFAAYGNSSFRVRCLTVVQVTRSPQDLCVWGEELDYPQVASWYTGYSVRGGFRVLAVVKGSFCSWRALEGDFCSTTKVVTNTLSCPQVLCVCMMPGWLAGSVWGTAACGAWTDPISQLSSHCSAFLGEHSTPTRVVFALVSTPFLSWAPSLAFL